MLLYFIPLAWGKLQMSNDYHIRFQWKNIYRNCNKLTVITPGGEPQLAILQTLACVGKSFTRHWLMPKMF